MAALRVVIVGSGFAGAILARILRRQGHDVLLAERGIHPRFALGESSTPLAAICLERLGARYDLDDLHHLAAYGRWLAHLPGVRRGLKRGFTFYAHTPGRVYRNDAHNGNRLLVAASPHDGVADTHWLREDVDHFLVQRAVAEGVEYLDRCEIRGLEPRGSGFQLAAESPAGLWNTTADLVVDASGAGGFLAGHLGIGSRLAQMQLNTGLVFGHFADLPPFVQVAREAGAELPEGPYPDDRAAVHHVIPEGWMYVLPFDHGVASAGFVLETADARRLTAEREPEAAWRELLSRYPTLAAQFANARPVRPIGSLPRLQRRLERAAGPNWALLPHAFHFLSPLFSTGIAWSLLGVERLALILETAHEAAAPSGAVAAGLQRYHDLLATEADHLEALVGGGYRARSDFELFCASSYLYFAAVSYFEAAQRLLPAPEGLEGWAWSGFAGSTDPVLREAVRAAAVPLGPGAGATSGYATARYSALVRRLIARRNVAGLASPARNRMYPVDLDALVASAHLLGLDADTVQSQLSRLRGSEVEA